MADDNLVFVISVYFLFFNVLLFQLNFLFALIMEKKKGQFEIVLDMEMRNSNGHFSNIHFKVNV